MRAILSVTIVVAATVSGLAYAGEGTLDKDQIREVVRAHIGEIRDCYNQGLARDPELKGKLVVDFEIASSGAVSRSEIGSATLPDQEMLGCVAAAVKTWTFPAPAGGSVAVEYPFLFEPG